MVDQEAIQIVTTCSTREEARHLGRAVVERRLAACAQVVGPIVSTYWWQGALEQSEEYMCVMKTERRLYEAAEQAIRELHAYDEPEILAVPIVAGSASYLAWLRDQLRHDIG